MAAAALAAVLVAVGHLAGWRGVDTAAQVYRVDSFRSSGFSLWDPRWYGGHWTLDYSVLYPPLAGTLGMLAVTVVSAALAALAFDRLARDHLGPGAAAASYLFAAGTLVAASIGQLPFLTGEAFGMAALWAADRGRYRPAALLALACTLTSPLTGAFLALATAAVAADRMLAAVRPVALRWTALTAAAGLPILATTVLFPGDGPMPYPLTDWLWEMVVAAAVGALALGRHRPLAIGTVAYALAATGAEIIPSALGGNVGRLEDAVALPLAVALAWNRLPVLVPLAAVPLFLSQWAPAAGAMTTAPGLPSAHRSFYVPLDRTLSRLAGDGPAARVEVVPTAYHWESAYVAPVMPLARGWERQLDEADNPLFYAPGALDPASYRAWLLDDGVRFVALASAPLDMAGRAEAALVSSGRVPGLRLVWHSADWHLYLVVGSPGIVSGPARLVRAAGRSVVLDASRPGLVTVRMRWSPDWYVQGGSGCVTRARSWLSVDVRRAGPVTLSLAPLRPGRTSCPHPSAATATPASPRG